MRKNHLSTFVLLCFSASLLARPMAVVVDKDQPEVINLSTKHKPEDTLLSMNDLTASQPNLLDHDNNGSRTVPIPLAPHKKEESPSSHGTPADASDSLPSTSYSTWMIPQWIRNRKQQSKVNTNDASKLGDYPATSSQLLDLNHIPDDQSTKISSSVPSNSPDGHIRVKLQVPEGEASIEDELHSPHVESTKDLELKSTEIPHSTDKGNHKTDPKGIDPQGTEPKPIQILDTPAPHPPQDGPAPKPGFIKRKWQQFLNWFRDNNSIAVRLIKAGRNYFRLSKVPKKSAKGKDVKDGVKLTKTVSSNKLSSEIISATPIIPPKPSSPNPVQDHLKINAEGADVKAAHTVSSTKMQPEMLNSNSVTHTIPLTTDSSKPVQADSKTDGKGVHNMEAATVPSNDLQPKDNSVTPTTDQKPESSQPHQDGPESTGAPATVRNPLKKTLAASIRALWTRQST